MRYGALTISHLEPAGARPVISKDSSISAHVTLHRSSLRLLITQALSLGTATISPVVQV
jgi:hypothetical protein